MLKEYTVSVFEVKVEVKAASSAKKIGTTYQHTRYSNAVEQHTNNDISCLNILITVYVSYNGTLLYSLKVYEYHNPVLKKVKIYFVICSLQVFILVL
jgi:hypothetical protein